MILNTIFYSSLDLKSGEFQNVPQNECNKLCDSKKENCCSAEAKCMCGTGTGLYTCLCPPGYSGSGINKICTRKLLLNNNENDYSLIKKYSLFEFEVQSGEKISKGIKRIILTIICNL